ncbi:hypothetical protein ATO6_19770 [Oceanicola sp. 22II-s10i]|nr:hypothetical protein ATO6_19770 [Oceanicola sp. 22II-s10i]
MLNREKDRCRAMLEGDWELLADCLSERLVFYHASGTLDGRAALLDKLTSGAIRYRRITHQDETVQDLGDVALLHSRLTADITAGPREATVDNQTLSVWVNEGGTWRLAAYQPTALKS